jgi:hypothetical protein
VLGEDFAGQVAPCVSRSEERREWPPSRRTPDAPGCPANMTGATGA